MNSIRLKRLESVLKKIISQTLSFEARDDRLQFIVINEVKLTQDLSYATVYFTYLSDIPKEKMVEILTRSSGFIKKHIAKEKVIRKIPKLKFVYDETEDRARKLEEIFQKIHKKE